MAAVETDDETGGRRTARGVHYKWIALSNTTIGILMATINARSC